MKQLDKKHDYDAAWKSILEAFEEEIVEVLFPEIYSKIAWELGTESLDKELQEIQKDIFHKDSSEKIISDKIIKVKLKNNESKILFIHVEVQSYSSGSEVFGERMFRYFYRIWDKFRYKYEDKSEIIAAAIYTYKGNRGKDKSYVYKLPELSHEILKYNFRTIDVETLNLQNINECNPLKLVFKIAKKLLEIGYSDSEIYNAKISLAEELATYDKVKNNEQVKSLVDFLEYLFLIQDEELENKYKEFKNIKGGAFKMTIDEIRRIYHEQKGVEQERKRVEQEKRDKIISALKKGYSPEIIAEILGVTNEEIEEVRKDVTL